MTPQQIEALERLTKLKESGTLTQQEFLTQKAAILGYQKPPNTPREKANPLKYIIIAGAVLLFCFMVAMYLIANPPKNSTAHSRLPTDTLSNKEIVAPAERARPIPAKDIEVTKHTWTHHDVSVATHSFTLVNKSNFAYYDIEVKFIYVGESGTAVDATTRVLHVSLPPKGKKRMNDYNAGFIPQDASQSLIEIINAPVR